MAKLKCSECGNTDRFEAILEQVVEVDSTMEILENGEWGINTDTIICAECGKDIEYIREKGE